MLLAPTAFFKKYLKAILMVGAGLLIGCQDQATAISNLVNANLEQNSYIDVVGSNTLVPVTFTTNTGTASNLSMDLSSLPPGWGKQISGSTFTCNNVQSSGTSCQLNLIYVPKQVTSNEVLSLTYTYTASDGTPKSGTINITYSAVNPPFAFIPNEGNGTVYGCMLSTSGTEAGTFSSCNPNIDGANIDSPTSMALFTATTGTEYAYIPNNNSGEVALCMVDTATGTLSNCQETPPSTTFANPQSISIASLTGGTFAYVMTPSTLYRCDVNPSTAALDNCNLLGSYDNGTSVTLHENSAGTALFAYILDASSSFGNGNLTKCTVDQTDGTFGSCSLEASSLPEAKGHLAFYTGNNSTFVYFINDFNGTTVAQYTVNGTDGSLSNATTTGTISANSQNVTVQTVNGTTYAYIPDSINEAITRCTVSPSTGSFSQCDQLATPDPASQSVPFDVVF